MNRFKEYFLKNTGPNQTISKNIFWLGSIQISRILRILTVIYATRILGTAEYGLFSYSIGLLGILGIFSDIGTGELLTRDIAKHKDKQAEYFATCFWIRVFLIFLTSVLIIFITPYISKIEGVRPLIYFLVLLMIFDNLRELMLAYIRGLEKMEWEALVFTVMNISLAVFSFFVLSFAPTAKTFIALYISTGALGLLTAFVLARKILGSIFTSFSKEALREVLSNAWPIVIMSLFGLMFNLDIVMLGWLRTPAEIGLYGAGQKIVQVLYTLPNILAASLLPTLSSLIKNNNKDEERNLIEKVISMIFLITFPAIAFGVLLSTQILQFVYGAEYIGGASVFKILIANTIIVFPSLVIYSIVVARNIQKKIIKYSALTSISNIFLNILLIPNYGIMGAAIATLISQAVGLSLIWRETKKASSFEILPNLPKIIMGSIIVGLLGFTFNLLGLHIVINAILSSISYLAFLILTKEKILYDLINIPKIEKFG